MRVSDWRRPRWAVLLVALIAVLSMGLTACGDDDDDSNGGTPASESSGSSSAVEDAKAAVEESTQPVTEWAGPEEAPPISEGKSVYVIGCSADVEGCVRDFDAAIAAAKEVGWRVTSQQTDGSPQGYVAAYNQAFDSNVDGIISAGIPAELISGPLRQATREGIPVVSMAANNDPGEVGEDFEGGLYAEIGPDQERMGAMAGEFIVADSEGEAVVGLLNDSAFPVLQVRIAGFMSVLDQCEGCEVKKQVNVPVPELAQRGAPAMLQFIRANPDVDYFFGSYDGGNIFAAQAVRQAGAEDRVKIVGQDGSAPNLDMIRDGGPQVASAAYSLELIGWAAVDQLNRAFNGEAPAEQWMPGNGAIPLKLIVQDNAPDTGPYVGDFSFEDRFRELWGIG